MRGPLDRILGRVGGLPKREVVRRTVPCYKYVLQEEGPVLSLCILVDHGRLYRFPYEKAGVERSLAIKARYLKGSMEHLRLREFQPGVCRYAGERPAATG
ncbi:MAG: hypothetical protein ACREPI_12475 [Candidatus Dormibacterales bacterium]